MKRLVLPVLIVALVFSIIGCSTGTSVQNKSSAQNITKENANAEKQFVGSINSNKYHYPSCRWAQRIYPENEIWFSSPQGAQAKGYVPCKVCRPPE